MVIEILLIVMVFLLLFLIYLVYKSGKVEPRDLENAISGVLEESGLSVEVGELATYARNMRDTHKSIEQVKKEGRSSIAVDTLA